MQNPVHEVGETARSVIDVFRSQPLALALSLMNAALIALLYYQGVSNSAERRHEQQLLYENRKIVTDALVKCSHPPPPHG
jgi:hypothetical protein